jgi:hypothetical protein
MKWILFFQMSNNIVRYITPELDNYTHMKYDTFLELLSCYKILDYANFFDSLNRFVTIYLDIETGEWKIIKPEDKSFNVSYEELLTLNKKNDEVCIYNSSTEQDKKQIDTKQLLYSELKNKCNKINDRFKNKINDKFKFKF